MAKKYASLSTLQNLVKNIKNVFATKSDVNAELAKKANSSHTHSISDVTNLQSTLDGKVPTSRTINSKPLTANITLSASDVGAATSSHTHDDRYYTESEVDTKLSGKANSSHTHTIANVTNLQATLDGKSNTSHNHTTHSQANMSNTDLNTIKTAGWYQGYTGMTNAPVQAIAVMEVLVYSPDWIVQRFTVVNGAEYIRHWHSATTWSEWKTEIDSGNIGSQSVASATKATQDGNGKVISSTYETKIDATSKLTEAKTYADNAANAVKNDLLNGAGGAYDTLKELGDLIDDNKDAIDALEEVAAGKANATHAHAISDVTNLQSALDGKANSSHGTHVSYSTTAPVMDGTASVGTAATVARSDHKHPTDTSRASKTEFDSHTSDTTKHITSTERTNWNAAKTHADSAHAPSNAEKNQNAFSNIAVSGQTTVVADTTTDTVTFVGSNVSITTDATNDKVTFSVANGTTSAKGVVQLTDSTSSTSTTTAATPNSVKSAYDLANTAKTNAATAQAKADSAYTLAEGKVDGLSDLGVTATATELNYMSGVTSNVQTQLDSKADTLTLIGRAGEGSGAEIFNDYDSNTASGRQAHAEGYGTTASGMRAHAEGQSTTASAQATHAEGYNTQATNTAAHSEGYYTEATGKYSHAEGYMSKAQEQYAHAEGYSNTASGEAAHAEGYSTWADGNSSHTEGCYTTASGDYSHAEGFYVEAAGRYQHVQGKYNIVDEDASGNPLDTYAHIVGNGTANNKRSNAHTLDWDGNAWYAGDIYVGGISQTDSDASKVITKADQRWNLLYDSGEISAIANSISNINVSGYTNIQVLVRIYNDGDSINSRAGSAIFTCENGKTYQFPVWSNMFSKSINTVYTMATFNLVDGWLICPCASRLIGDASTFEDEGGTAGNLSLTGSGMMKCTSPLSTLTVSSLDQNSNYYFGMGSRVMVWGWNG